MCGCRSNQKTVGRGRRVLTSPASRSITRGVNANNQTPRQLQLKALAAQNEAPPSGMTKAQRDVERKRRAQIALRRFGK